MRFTISPSILAQWSRVTAWQVYTLCDSVVCQQTRGRGVSQATRMSWPSSMSPPPKVSSPISLSFTSLPPSLRFVPPCLMSRSHLAALPCYWPTLLPSVLRNFRYSDILGIISAQTSEWEQMTVIRGIVKSSRSSGDASCPRRLSWLEGRGQTYL